MQEKCASRCCVTLAQRLLCIVKWHLHRCLTRSMWRLEGMWRLLLYAWRLSVSLVLLLSKVFHTEHCFRLLDTTNTSPLICDKWINNKDEVSFIHSLKLNFSHFQIFSIWLVQMDVRNPWVGDKLSTVYETAPTVFHCSKKNRCIHIIVPYSFHFLTHQIFFETACMLVWKVFLFYM